MGFARTVKSEVGMEQALPCPATAQRVLPDQEPFIVEVLRMVDDSAASDGGDLAGHGQCLCGSFAGEERAPGKTHGGAIIVRCWSASLIILYLEDLEGRRPRRDEEGARPEPSRLS
jgi:hypothetical protein